MENEEIETIAKIVDKSINVKRILTHLYNKPNNYEKRVSWLCVKYQLPFLYTGNGLFYINHKNPDFKHVSLPIVIEVFDSRLFNRSNYEEEQREFYKKNEYDVILINENDLMNENWEITCLERINIIIQKYNIKIIYNEQDLKGLVNKFNYIIKKKQTRGLKYIDYLWKLVAGEILIFLKNNNIELFERRTLSDINIKYKYDSVTKALRYLINNNKIERFGARGHEKYKIIKSPLI